MGSDHRTMGPGLGPTFSWSNQRLWRMIPYCRSSQAFQHGSRSSPVPFLLPTTFAACQRGKARRKSGPVNSRDGRENSAKYHALHRTSAVPARSPAADVPGGLAAPGTLFSSEAPPYFPPIPSPSFINRSIVLTSPFRGANSVTLIPAISCLARSAPSVEISASSRKPFGVG